MKPGWRFNLIASALWLAAAAVSVVLALLIGGCASLGDKAPHRVVGSGQVVAAPAGHVQFCRDNPTHAACPREVSK